MQRCIIDDIYPGFVIAVLVKIIWKCGSLILGEGMGGSWIGLFS